MTQPDARQAAADETDTARVDSDEVEPIGAILRRLVERDDPDLALSWGRPPSLPDRAPPVTVTPGSRSSPSRDAATSCPRCAGDQARLYRPGAPTQGLAVTSPEAAAGLLVPMLDSLDREHCVTLNLDTKHRLIATTTVSIGSIDHTFMSPREVFRDALLHAASAIVVAHNHPSGDAEPSRDDERVTRRLAYAADVVGINVLGHVVVGHQRWVSLVPHGAHLERATGEIVEVPSPSRSAIR